MTLQTVAHCRGMNLAFYIDGILVRVAGKTESVRSRCDQLDVGYVFYGADLMATRAAHSDRGMNRLALGLVFMAGDAGRGIGLRVERHWMFRGGNRTNQDEYRDEAADCA